MTNVCLIAASLMAQGQAPGWQLAISPARAPRNAPAATSIAVAQLCRTDVASRKTPTLVNIRPEYSRQTGDVFALRGRQTQPQMRLRPTSGRQLYRQRLEALKMGLNHAQLPTDSFKDKWLNATYQPTYQQWLRLLAQEATLTAEQQKSQRLSVIVGDSHALWFPPGEPSDRRLWLNQGISGDTTAGVLQRLSLFDQTRPDTIHVVVGINDLRRGKKDEEILGNLRQIMTDLRQKHPEAQIFVHSVLPTRLAALPSHRIHWLNQNIAALSRRQGVNFLNLQSAFADNSGNLRRALTTDGIHLNARGYQIWQ
jgi:lysophospholipase L1-like esterase